MKCLSTDEAQREHEEIAAWREGGGGERRHTRESVRRWALPLKKQPKYRVPRRYFSAPSDDDRTYVPKAPGEWEADRKSGQRRWWCACWRQVQEPAKGIDTVYQATGAAYAKRSHFGRLDDGC